MRHIIPISGKDSCATALLQMAHRPDLDYELFFSDIGCELPDTYTWLDQVEKKLNRPIFRIGKSLERVIAGEGILPGPHTRFCTRKAKIEPMEEFIGLDEATVYFGIRADEDRIGYVPTKAKITPAYPLREAGVGLGLVYQILEKADLLPPTFFWQKLHDQVVYLLDCRYRNCLPVFPGTQDILGRLPVWAKNHLFAWRSRSNCYFCFFQRRYEWVGLLEHYPELFDRAEAIEKRIGNDRQQRPYTWIRDCSLANIRRDRDKILAKQARKVAAILIRGKLHRDPLDELSITSCGLFCGK